MDGSGLAVTSFSHSRPSLLQLGFRFRRLALFRPGLGLALGWAYPSKELVLPRRVVYRVSEWVSEVVPPRRRRQRRDMKSESPSTPTRAHTRPSRSRRIHFISCRYWLNLFLGRDGLGASHRDSPRRLWAESREEHVAGLERGRK